MLSRSYTASGSPAVTTGVASTSTPATDEFLRELAGLKTLKILKIAGIDILEVFKVASLEFLKVFEVTGLEGLRLIELASLLSSTFGTTLSWGRGSATSGWSTSATTSTTAPFELSTKAATATPSTAATAEATAPSSTASTTAALDDLLNQIAELSGFLSSSFLRGSSTSTSTSSTTATTTATTLSSLHPFVRLPLLPPPRRPPPPRPPPPPHGRHGALRAHRTRGQQECRHSQAINECELRLERKDERERWTHVDVGKDAGCAEQGSRNNCSDS
ncbi:hypothetical protein FA13DRAFT_1117679 [Coprinellus micaceus]|uniref:Uncharacterized protein n=1 Tax=Coprinellus micaceus TaxID=71717 RepID=A0A4Y7RJP5_COPMI|nr:hypothetical protein FA13DRAFT_1117679 [Coprinellus micaceus]